jgi:hypothetical protein
VEFLKFGLEGKLEGKLEEKLEENKNLIDFYSLFMPAPLRGAGRVQPEKRGALFRSLVAPAPACGGRGLEVWPSASPR